MKLPERGCITHPGYKNRAIVKCRAGHQNFRLKKDGTFDLVVGTIKHGNYAEITPEIIAFRDEIRKKQLLPIASY